MDELRKGDYVVATKWYDGDPQDHWCVGWFDGILEKEPCIERGLDIRFMVVDHEANQYRGNGFRRIEKISPEIGQILVENMPLIEISGHSVWICLSWIRLFREFK